MNVKLFVVMKICLQCLIKRLSHSWFSSRNRTFDNICIEYGLHLI